MRTRALPLRLVALGALGVLAGCRSETGQAGASASAAAKPPAPARAEPPPPLPTGSAARPKSGCRVLGVTGKAAEEPGNPAVGTLFRDEDFVELRADVEVSLRHTETARELSLRGPGRFQPCKAGAEGVIVARGTVLTAAGAGSRAGAEVLLATPFGVVHYADARLTLEVDEQKLVLRVEQGSATLERAVPAKEADAGKVVSGPNGKLSHAGKVDAGALVEACTQARRAVGGAAPKPAGAAGAGLGDWAANQLKARRAARYVCSTAHAAVGRLTGPELTRLSGLLAATHVTDPPAAGPGK